MQTTTAAAVSMDTPIQCSEGQMTADLGRELAILSLNTGIYFGLDEVGALIWNALKDGRTLRETRDLIMSQYSVDAGRCERDLLKLVTDLLRHDLVKFVDGNAP